jgi:hypothetical protein
MGGQPYWYAVEYAEPALALSALRRREFAAGRYFPARSMLHFGVDAVSEDGAKHASIDAARDDAAETGTRSILDIDQVGKQADYGVAAPLSDDELIRRFGSAQPDLATVRARLLDLLEGVQRGMCRYVVAYEAGRPSGLFFAGYSYD